jgi:Phospholipase_D-nuclease N-terminal
MFGFFHPLFWVVLLIVDVVAIYSILAGSKPAVEKLLWTVVIVLLPLIGLVLYFLLGRDARDAQIAKR